MRILSCADFETWKTKAKQMLNENVHPREILWQDVEKTTENNSFESSCENTAQKVYKVSKILVDLAEAVSCHKNPKKWELLYSVLWRTLNGETFLLDDESDYEVRKLILMRKQVRREIRKARLSIRFKKTQVGKKNHFIAWYECDHNILEQLVPFFKRRFPKTSWTLFTPYASARWDTKTIVYHSENAANEMPPSELDKIYDLQTSQTLPSSNFLTPQKSLFLSKDSLLTQLSAIFALVHKQVDILFVAQKSEKCKPATRLHLIEQTLKKASLSGIHFHLTYVQKDDSRADKKLTPIKDDGFPWLERKIMTQRPKIIICLGKTATEAIMDLQKNRRESNQELFKILKSVEIMYAEDCFEYASHPQFKEKFEALIQRIEGLFIKACAA